MCHDVNKYFTLTSFVLGRMKQYTIGMMGFNESVVLELTYKYGVTEYKKGNAYAQVCA